MDLDPRRHDRCTARSVFPLGYVVRSRETVIDRAAAQRVLTPKRQRTAVKAVRRGDSVAIVRRVAVCPRCGAEAPLCAPLPGGGRGVHIRTPEEIGRWADDQTSLFPDAHADLTFQKPAELPELYTCPGCRGVFPKSDGRRQALLRARRKKITVALPLEPADRFCLRWTEAVGSDDAEVTEELTFNLSNGHTYLSLIGGSGRRYATRDVTDALPDGFEKDPVIDLVENCKPVARRLKRMLQAYWPCSIPFTAGELRLERYVLLTRFVGYDRAFYDSIPFVEYRNSVERSFRPAAKRLHLAGRVPRLLDASRLPRVKSIRRIVFASPEWLFYLHELESVWALLGNVDLFRSFLASGLRNVRVLAGLYQRPALVSFLSEFAAVCGKRRLTRLLAHDGWAFYGAGYLSMSRYYRLAERKKWQDGHLRFIMHGHSFDLPYSVPTPVLTDRIAAPSAPPDRVVCGYRFHRLCNSNEYLRAGKELHNCLQCWEGFDGTVFGVEKHGRYVAAVELDGRRIRQAYAGYNSGIGDDPALAAAYDVWVEENGLYGLICPEDEDAAMPF